MKTKIIIISIIAAILLLLFTLDPSLYTWIPKCPFHLLTGLDCPACGSQRAIHAFLHLQFTQAFAYNPFLVLSLPYLFCLVLTRWFVPQHQLRRLRRFCNNRLTIFTYLILLIIWWIIRNIY